MGKVDIMEDSFEFLPDDTIVPGDTVEINNAGKKCYGKVSSDEGRGFYDCEFGSKFDGERGVFPKKGIFSKFSLKLAE